MRSKILLASLVLTINTASLAWAGALTVAVAASARFAFEEIRQAFEQETEIDVKTVVGSSGKLTAQIEQGAPFDVFLSADTDYPRRLYEKGLTATKPRVYGYGRLVLWTLSGKDVTGGIMSLRDAGIRTIAIADPRLAPYGREALAALRRYRLDEALTKKFIYGESVAQVNQFVVSRAADVGFTAKAVVLADSFRGGQWVEVPTEAYRPIAQAAVVLKGSSLRQVSLAERFFAFLFSPRAREILRQYGYGGNERE